MSRRPRTRRAVLSGVAAGLASTAGCAGRGPSPDRATGRDTDEAGTPTATTTAAATTAASGPLRLSAIDVGGSPGGEVSLRPPGKAVLLDFFATWCEPCKPEMENLGAVRSRFEESELAMVSITQEVDTEAIKTFWRTYDGTWPVVTDPELRAGQKYQVTNLPTIIVLAPDGTETFRHTGLAGEERLVSGVRPAIEE